MKKQETFPNLGIGVGLRPIHYEEIFNNPPLIDWFEIISENYLEQQGPPIENLERILEIYPVVLHGVSLSIGGPTPLDFDYLKKLKALIRKTQAPWVSDHLCWGRLPGRHYHDLFPLPYTKEVASYVVERAKVVQDFLEVPFALENLSSYVSYCIDEMPEWEFYASIVEQADVHMMLDLNNVYVSSRNHDFSPDEYLNYLPLERVIQIHLAGHRDCGDYVIDTHDNYVCDTVWQLYRDLYPKIEGVSTLLEWDDHFISFEKTCEEALKAKAIQKELQLV